MPSKMKPLTKIRAPRVRRASDIRFHEIKDENEERKECLTRIESRNSDHSTGQHSLRRTESERHRLRAATRNRIKDATSRRRNRRVTKSSDREHFSDHYRLLTKDKLPHLQHIHVHLCESLDKTKRKRSAQIVNTEKLSRWKKHKPLLIEPCSLELWADLPIHENILDLFEWFQGSKGYVYLVLEECFSLPETKILSEELEDKDISYDEVWISSIMEQILKGLVFLHNDEEIVHSDLRPDHVVLVHSEENGKMDEVTIKLKGLGACSECGEAQSAARTGHYTAPEVLADPSYVANPARDMWACGVMAFILLSRRLPHHHEDATNNKSYQRLLQSDKLWRNPSVSNLARDFITRCLHWNAESRLTAVQALKHPWISTLTPSIPRPLSTTSSSTQKTLSNIQAFFAPRSKLQQAALFMLSWPSLLEEEKEAIDKVFFDLDTAKNGKLSKGEVMEGFERIFGYELSQEEVDDLFDRLDSAENGFIDYSEFVVAAMNEKNLLSNGKLKSAFENFDVDCTGKISAQNLQQVFGELPMDDLPNEASEIQQMIKRFDVSGDGHLSYSEFVTMMLDAAAGRIQQHGASATAIEKMAQNNNYSHSSFAANWLVCNRNPDPEVHSHTLSEQNYGSFDQSYTIGSLLGEGVFKEVYSCHHKSTGITRAVKISKNFPLDQEEALQLEHEIEILKQLDHPNLPMIYASFVDNWQCFTVTDYLPGGDLCDELDNNGCLTEERAAIFMKHLLGCVNYLHQRSIIHRDIKPDDILFYHGRDLDRFKLVDFARATRCEDGKRLTKRVTTPQYTSPEVLAGNYGAKLDIFSCGVVCFLVLSNSFPFDADSRQEVYDLIEAGKFSFSDAVWKDVSIPAMLFIRRLLTYDEDYRPSAAQALEDQWFESVEVSNDPSKRVSMKEHAKDALDKMLHQQHIVPSNMKQATHALIAAQMLLKKENERIDRVFHAIDTNRDGRLSKDEVRAGYAAYFGKGLGDEEVDEIFERVDQERSGYLEYSEFVVAAMNESDLFSNDKVKHAFDMFDVSKSGKISKKELRKALSDALDMDKATDDGLVAQLITQLDSEDDDSDEFITFDEFTVMLVMTIP